MGLRYSFTSPVFRMGLWRGGSWLNGVRGAGFRVLALLLRLLFNDLARQHDLHSVGGVVMPRSARASAAAAEKVNGAPQLAQTISSSLCSSMDVSVIPCPGVEITVRGALAAVADRVES